MIERFRQHWIHLALAVMLVLTLHPTPVSRPLVSNLAAFQIAMRAGRPDAALERLEAALTFEPSLESLHIIAAQLALETGDPARAVSHLNHAVLLNASNPLVACLRSRVLLADGELQASLRLWQSIPAACPQPETFFQQLARMSLAGADRERAIYALEQLTNLNASDPPSQLAYGYMLATQDPEGALPVLRRARTASLELGMIASQLISTIEDALPTKEKAYTLAQVGQFLAKRGEWRYAVWAFEQALVLEPSYVEARAFLGLARDQAGEDGLEDLQLAAEAAPHLALPHIFLARHWLQVDQPQEALRVLEVAARLEPENPGIVADIGNAYIALGDLQAARAAFLQATQIAPQDATFWITLAQFSLNQEIEVASLGLPAARNAVVLAPQDPFAWDLLGYAHLLLENSMLAGRMLAHAIDLQPERAATQFHLGLFHQMQGNLGRASAAFRTAALLDPSGLTGRMAENALERLPIEPGSGP